MNKVENKVNKPVVGEFAPSDIFIDKESGELYMMVCFRGKYFCVCLNDGIFWGGSGTKEDATKSFGTKPDLTFLKRGAKITVE